MRGLFGLVGLVVVLAIVGITVKKQLGAPQQASVGDNTPQQVQQQYKQA